MSTVTTSVRLDAVLAKRLRKAAVRLSRGRNWVITRALEDYLAKVNRDDLAKEAMRQSAAAARDERRLRKKDFYLDEDIPGWK